MTPGTRMTQTGIPTGNLFWNLSMGNKSRAAVLRKAWAEIERTYRKFPRADGSHGHQDHVLC